MRDPSHKMQKYATQGLRLSGSGFDRSLIMSLKGSWFYIEPSSLLLFPTAAPCVSGNRCFQGKLQEALYVWTCLQVSESPRHPIFTRCHQEKGRDVLLLNRPWLHL